VKPDEIKVGHFYVGRKASYLVREITDERSANDVYWRSYDVATGEATGDSGVCSTQSVAQWAEREATEEEKAKLDRDQADVKDAVKVIRYFENALRNAPDDLLLAEVRRRGLKHQSDT
jgi:hypothetical protein